MLPADLAGEPEGGVPDEHRPLKPGGRRAQAGLFEQLPQGALAQDLPAHTAADREPPAVIRIVDVVAADEQEPTVRVEDDDSGRLAFQDAVGRGGPLRVELGHGPRCGVRRGGAHRTPPYGHCPGGPAG